MSEPIVETTVEPGEAPDTTARIRSARRRVIAISLCAAVAAGGLGFIGGYRASRSSLQNVASTRSGAETANSTEGSTSANATITGGSTAGAPTPAMPATGMASSDSKMSAAAGGGGGQYSAGAYADLPQRLLAERTTASGITMRAHLQDYGAQMEAPYGNQFPGWMPAGWCFPTGQLRISIVTANSVNLGGAPWYTDPKGGVAVSTFASGYVESAPVFGASVQVAANVSSVTFTTASGLSDSTTPSNSVALLAINGPIENTFTVTLNKTDGSTTSLGTAELTATYSSTEYQKACNPPPPALPAAGEQPADPAAAEAAVRESWRLSRDFAGTDPSVRITYVDDSTGIQDAWNALSAGQFATAAMTATQPIAELVFSSPTEAWFRYDVLTSITNFYNRYGMARLGDNGVWRITRQTVCQDLSLAPGIACSPAVETLLPPSAANDPRYGQPIPVDGVVIAPTLMPTEGAPAVDPAVTVSK